MASTERAVLAGAASGAHRIFVRRQRGSFPARSAIPAATCPTPPTATTATHAEAIEIVFDPTQTAFRKLRSSSSDPRSDDKNRQGNDIGMSYRSAIFYTSPAERVARIRSPMSMRPSCGRKVVTEIRRRPVLGGEPGIRIT